MPYDLTVAYRIYPKVTKAAPIFSDDKLKMAELCLESFRRSLGSLRVRMIVLLDGCPPEFGKLFTDRFPAADLELLWLDRIGNQDTFDKQIELLCTQEHSDVVYFAEDDYFYLPNTVPTMLEFLRQQPGVDFVSPYDHTDLYELALHRYQSTIQFFGDRHWRTVSSTCLTFLTRKQTLRKCRPTFESYVNKNLDASLWMALTKHLVFNPAAIARCWAERWQSAGYVGLSWYHNWPQILFGKTYQLWTPLPAVATHMVSGFEAKGIDWHKEFARQMAQLG